MRINKIAHIIFVSIVIAGCASQKPVSTGAGSKYSEDLSVWRPKIDTPRDTVIGRVDERKNTPYIEPQFAVNKKLDEVLDSIDRINLSKKFVEGYTIQVFSGKREEALNVRKQLTTVAPDIGSEVQFTEPIFRVKAGKYFNWLDAQKDFSVIKKYFPAAIIIPDKIALN